MLEYGYYNMDCMQGMKEFPDKYFDLAIIDPPYGIKVDTYGRKKGRSRLAVAKDYENFVGGAENCGNMLIIWRKINGRRTKRNN